MTPNEISQKMLDVFFRHPETTKDLDARELTRERNFDTEEFEELMSDVSCEFEVTIPVKPSRYVYAPPGIDKGNFTIQQLADYVSTLLNEQES